MNFDGRRIAFRIIAGIVTAVLVWWFLFMAIGIGIGLLWPDYQAAARAMFESDDLSFFTTPMLLTNWIIFIGAGLGAGWLVTVISANQIAPRALAVGFLVTMMINHYIIVWDEMPYWYNMIVPFVIAISILLGNLLVSARFRPADPETS
jgi:hypothetical protein